MAPPLSAIKIVNKYCGVWGRGGGRQNTTKDNGAPLSVIKIVQYCGVWGGIEGRQNPTKDNGALLSVIKIAKYCGVMGRVGVAKILQKIMAPFFLSLR